MVLDTLAVPVRGVSVDGAMETSKVLVHFAGAADSQ